MSPTGGGTTAQSTNRQHLLHTDKGTLPMSNYETSEYFTPLIATIISYNGFKIIH